MTYQTHPVFFKFILYADGSTFSVPIPSNLSVEDNNQLSDLINAELCNVSNCRNANKIMVNTNKTNYIIFSYKRKLLSSGIKMNTTELKKKSTKFLGVILDENLIFKDHINFLRTKISKWVGIMYKLKSILYN